MDCDDKFPQLSASKTFYCTPLYYKKLTYIVNCALHLALTFNSHAFCNELQSSDFVKCGITYHHATNNILLRIYVASA